MYQNSEDIIECTKCNSKVLNQVWDIHRIMCDNKKSKKKSSNEGKQQSFFSSIKRKIFEQENEQKSQSNDTIPCLECGQNVPFNVYQLHQQECIGHQLTLCNKCGLQFPTFLMNQHNQVCTGKNVQVQPNINDWNQNQISDPEEDHEQIEQLNNLISNLAIYSEKVKQQGLNKKQIDSLNCFTITKQEDCAICCTAMKRMHRNIRLNCKHTFHKQCIGPWLAQNPLCPMCRRHALKK